jgi:hypothetical protein
MIDIFPFSYDWNCIVRRLMLSLAVYKVMGLDYHNTHSIFFMVKWYKRGVNYYDS